jgi:hypothetical protein
MKVTADSLPETFFHRRVRIHAREDVVLGYVLCFEEGDVLVEAQFLKALRPVAVKWGVDALDEDLGDFVGAV